MLPNLLVISSDLVEFSNVLSIIIVIIFLTFTSIILLRIWQRELLNNRQDINNLKNGLKDLKSLSMTALQSPFTILLDDKYVSNFSDGCFIKTQCTTEDTLLWPLWGVSSSHLFEMLNHPWAKWKSLLNNKSFINCLYQGEPISLVNPTVVTPLQNDTIHKLFESATSSQKGSPNICSNAIEQWHSTHIKRPKFLKEQLLGSAPRTRYPLVLVTLQSSVNHGEPLPINNSSLRLTSTLQHNDCNPIRRGRNLRLNKSRACKVSRSIHDFDQPSNALLSDSEADDISLGISNRSQDYLSQPETSLSPNSHYTNGASSIVASISIVHLQDSISSQPSSIMGQYLKSHDESIYILQQLYVISPDSGNSDNHCKNGSDKCNTSPIRSPRRRIPSRTCIVCGTRQADQVILPCRHVCCCKTCLQKLDKCPMCRGIMHSFWVMK